MCTVSQNTNIMNYHTGKDEESLDCGMEVCCAVCCYYSGPDDLKGCDACRGKGVITVRGTAVKTSK